MASNPYEMDEPLEELLARRAGGFTGGQFGPRPQIDQRGPQAGAMPLPGAGGIQPSMGEGGEAVEGSGQISPEDLMAGYARRGGGTGGPWKGAGKGALEGAKMSLYTGGVAAPILIGGGAIVGGIAGAINKKAKSAPTDFKLADAQQALRNTYKTAWGREASPEEIDGIIRGQGWQPGDRYVGEKGLRSVIEATQRSAAAELAGRQPEAEAAAAVTPEVAAPPAEAAKAGAGGGLTRDSFMALTQKYPHTIEGLQKMMAENPEMFAGVERFGSKGEKLRLPNGQVIDTILGAGAGGQGWQWLEEDPNAQPRIAHEGMRPGQGLPGGMPMDQDFFKMIMARLQKDAGMDNGLNREALLSLLG
jgi:hypothetical protein